MHACLKQSRRTQHTFLVCVMHQTNLSESGTAWSSVRGYLVYIDDILMFGESFDSALDVGLQLKFSEYELFQTQVPFLDHHTYMNIQILNHSFVPRSYELVIT